jgi:formylglycine-generating enzyme required for sulfatase activity
VNDPLPLTRIPWDAVISKATAKETQARYSSAAEFSKALHAENNAPDNHDATVVGGGKEETVVQKGHDKTFVDDAPKQRKDISLKERFEQEKKNSMVTREQRKSPKKTWLFVTIGALVITLLWNVLSNTRNSEVNTLETPKELNIEMIEVKGGTFFMGSNDGNDEERPVHEVTLSDFSIGKYEVTQAQWRAVMGNSPSYFAGCEDCPVESVSWDDVQQFISKLNIM